MGLFNNFHSLRFCEEIKLVLLPSPQIEGDRPLMQALKDRGSSRSFSSEKLSSAEKICRSKKTVDIPFKRVYFEIKKSGCKR